MKTRSYWSGVNMIDNLKVASHLLSKYITVFNDAGWYLSKLGYTQEDEIYITYYEIFSLLRKLEKLIDGEINGRT